MDGFTREHKSNRMAFSLLPSQSSQEALAIEADKSAIEAWEEANREKLVSVKAAEAALAAVDAALAFGEDFSERVRIAIFDAENAEKIAANNAADAALACARAAADLVAVLAKQAEEEAEEAEAAAAAAAIM
jgi:hypothetical protein